MNLNVMPLNTEEGTCTGKCGWAGRKQFQSLLLSRVDGSSDHSIHVCSQDHEWVILGEYREVTKEDRGGSRRLGP